ncbi:dTDP-glucose 4,6-dehydratase [Metabacillus fastidiosus]|uniref:dTDP-glucose 4,6-dehydratase n=1 Tax=Metabacillus fastidiosus TaxID=1458 RepID=UPI003D2A34AA
MRILLTGGAGFIGTNFTHYIFERNPEVCIVNLSTATSDSSARNVKLFSNNFNYTHIEGNIGDAEAVKKAFKDKIDILVNFAAQSHVDKSIHSARSFIDTNVLGTQMLLELARQYGVGRFIQISSAEVYGSIEVHQIVSESTVLSPINPYAVSKASSDLLALSYYKTYGMDIVVARCTNNYGSFQKPDKFIPLVITRALNREPIPLYSSGMYARDWLHVRDHCAALYDIMHGAAKGSIYNIASNSLAPTKEIVEIILKITGQPWSLVEHKPGRLGDGDRYPPCSRKIREELGWAPAYNLMDGLQETVEWYEQNIFCGKSNVD